MPYTAGTFGTTGPTRAAFRSVLDTALTGAGWVVVGNYAEISYYTDVPDFYRVWRLPKSVSGQGTDLYLISWTDANAGTANGYADANGDITVTLTITEDFDTSTRLVTKAVPNLYYSGAQTTSAGYYPGFGTGVGPRTIMYRNMSISAGGQFWLSVTSKRIAFATRRSDGQYSHAYAGFVDDIMPSTMSNLGGALLAPLTDTAGPTGQIGGGWTREPGVQATTDVSYIFGAAMGALFLPFYDPYYYGGYHVVPTVAYHYRNGVRTPRGYLSGIYASADASSLKQTAMVPGDTITVGSKTYVAMNQVSYNQATFLVDTSV